MMTAKAIHGAIKAIFLEVFGEAEGLGPMLTYAVIVTLIAVIVTIWVGRAAAKAKKEE